MGRHRLLQFGLRTSLISVAALSAWFGLYVRNVRSQQAAVQGIQDYGGWVRYDFQYPTGTYTYKDTDGGLIHLSGLTSLETLFIQGAGITDEGLKHLGVLTTLKWVVISSDAVTSEGLATLQARLPTTRCSLSRSTARASGERN